jgi:maltooligosyltrehalose trehalohydrolase
MTWRLPIGAQANSSGVHFRVWAPEAQIANLILYRGGQPITTHTLASEPNGYWSTMIEGIGTGVRYAYSIDGGVPRPDPASRSQPDGVHAPSEVVDLAFDWSDGDWHGVSLDDLSIYELHVGTATPAGTFEALIEKLPHFRELGVTALEIMPIADFPGDRNWGYDGVALFAPARSYGGPVGFKRLVDAAHSYGLAIILDVVYNHLGPDGNYLRVFSPYYFTDRHHTPWGEAINFDGPGSTGVRDFFVNNALYWLHEYHVDGLRFDATHALIDDSQIHILEQIVTAVQRSLPGNRHVVLIAEDERNEARLARPQQQGGYGLDAVWADDFHHQVRVALTGEQGGYYVDYSGSMDDLAKTIVSGWFYQGQRTARGRRRGTSPHELRLPQFVYCIQNHDQIGNRALGDRLNHAVTLEAYRAASALLLLVPQTPLLFQGQEWAATTPFQFFTDHHPDLGRLVTEGRRKEFAAFWAKTGIEVPDPQAEDTFKHSKLRWDEREQGQHAATLALYRDLLALRRTHPALRRRDREALHIAPISDRALIMRRDGFEPADGLLVVANLSSRLEVQFDTTSFTAAPTNRPWRILLDTNATHYGGSAPARLLQTTATPRLEMNAAGVVVLSTQP